MVVAVVSMAEWVGFTAGAAGEDTVVAGEDTVAAGEDTVAAGEDTVAAIIQGTGLAFPATGLITGPDGVILTTVILIITIIPTRLIHTQLLIRIQIMPTPTHTRDPLRPTAHMQMEGRFIRSN